MAPKIKNIILFTAIAVLLILIYIFFIKKTPEEGIKSSPVVDVSSQNTSVLNQSFSITEDFLSVLLNVRSIKLDDSIFSDKAFVSLYDSAITLTPTGDEGRPNPFAPIGFEEALTTLETPAKTP